MPVMLMPDVIRTESREQLQALLTTAAPDRVRVRLLVQLYDPQANLYRHWKGTGWRLGLSPSLEVGQAFLDATAAALHAMTVLGPEQTAHVLRQAVEAALPLSPISADPDAQTATEDLQP